MRLPPKNLHKRQTSSTTAFTPNALAGMTNTYAWPFESLGAKCLGTRTPMVDDNWRKRDM